MRLGSHVAFLVPHVMSNVCHAFGPQRALQTLELCEVKLSISIVHLFICPINPNSGKFLLRTYSHMWNVPNTVDLEMFVLFFKNRHVFYFYGLHKPRKYLCNKTSTVFGGQTDKANA